MTANSALPPIPGLDKLIAGVSETLPEWAKQTMSWLSESPSWASTILSQSKLYLHITLNAEMIMRELEGLESGKSMIVQQMLDNPSFRLHAFPGTHQQLTDWAPSQNEAVQNKVRDLIGKLPETPPNDMRAWNEARNLFPVIGDKKAPFLAMTFAFGEHQEKLSETMPVPSSLRLWDMSGDAQLLTHLQQGSVTFYICELNLPTLLTLLLQFTTVMALSVVKWISKISAVLSDLMQGAVEGLRKIPKEVLLATLGALAAALLIPAVREQLGEWLTQSKAWFEANYAHLMEWAGNWASEMQVLLNWFRSVSLLGGLLTEQVSADLMAMLQSFMNKPAS